MMQFCLHYELLGRESYNIRAIYLSTAYVCNQFENGSFKCSKSDAPRALLLVPPLYLVPSLIAGAPYLYRLIIHHYMTN